MGWVKPIKPARERSESIGVVGAGPAGLAAAEFLRRKGYQVTVYDRYDRVGGLMIYGIPGFKLEKPIVLRRAEQLTQGGIQFKLNCELGRDVTLAELQRKHDAVLLAIGVYKAREMAGPGSGLDNIVPALSYLTASNRKGLGDAVPEFDSGALDAKGKRVVVIGGGDTGMDCVSNALREGAEDVLLLDVYPEVPASGRYPNTPWPVQPRRLITTYALEEGGERRFGRQVLGLEGRDGRVSHVVGREVTGESSRSLTPVEGSEFAIETDLVLIAVGFTNPEHEGLLDDLGVTYDRSGNVKAGSFATSIERVYAAGDTRVGASLIVTAIAEGRRCARVVEAALRD
jgi:glutamate synthase (NADPH/NADH) small chain